MSFFKIAFLVSSFPTVSETFIVNQITDLIDRGHTIKIFAFSKNKNIITHKKILDYQLLEKTIYLEDIKISKIKRYLIFFEFIMVKRQEINFRKLLGMFNFRKYGKKALNLRNFLKYKQILNEGNFDIFHAHFGVNGAYLAEMKAVGFSQKTKLIVSFHGYDLMPRFLPEYKIKYEKLFKEADLLTVNTEYTESLLQQISTNGNIKVLPVGLDTVKFRKKTYKANSTFQILFVGRLIPLKAPNLSIEILKNLIERGFWNIKLTIVGEGELCTHLKETIGQNDLDKFVELKGALSQEEMIKAMDHSDIFLFPGIYDNNGRAETQGLVIQEAQAMELPVVVSDAGGMKYGMRDGETGFVVKEKDIEAFADTIEFLIQNEEKRLKMGKKGRDFVQEYYDSRVLGGKLVACYHQILAKE